MKKFSKILSRRLGRGADDGDSGLGPPIESAHDYHQLRSTRRWRGVGNGDEDTGSAVGRFRRRLPRTESSLILANGSPEAGSPCGACANINFPRLLDWQPGDARPWISLAHTVKESPLSQLPSQPRLVKTLAAEKKVDDESDSSSPPPSPTSTTSSMATGPCPWCAFFKIMITTPLEGDVDGHEEQLEKKDGSIKSKFTPYLRIRLAFERLGVGEKHELGKSVLFEVTTRDRSLPWGYIVKASSTADNDQDNPCARFAGYGFEKGGKEAPKVIQGRKVSAILDPLLPKSWIDFCHTKHSQGSCAVEARTVVPGLRLIDCETRHVVASQDLGCATNGDVANGEHKHQGHTPEYVTLSYARGNHSDQEDQEVGVNGELPKDIPPLVVDAMSMTRSLGYRYLWVDLYCMPRKEHAPCEKGQKSERRQQLDLMGRIYGQSVLTMIVAAGEGMHEGIPGISAPREEQLTLKTESGLFTTSLLRPDLEVSSSAWASRAWTCQEGLLAKRRLVFTSSQVYFQCQTLHCHESLSHPLALSEQLNLGRVFPLASEVLKPAKLKNRIKTYMSKEITWDEDRLDAFRGVLYEYSKKKKLPVDHFLGLPLFHPDDFVNAKVVSQTDRLAIALGWMPCRSPATSQGEGNLQPVDPYYLLETPPCHFPSWSWLAWRLQTDMSGPNAPNFTFNFNLVNDTTPLVEGVCAAPQMEISVGFGDGMVVSWEIDGDAIGRKADRIEFLRLKTYCFDLVVKKPAGNKSALSLAEPAASTLGRTASDDIEAWVRRSLVGVVADAAEDAPADEEYQLIGVLVSGRNWKPSVPAASVTTPPPTPTAAGAASATAPATATATVLICGRRNWGAEAPLVRLGALSVSYAGLVAAVDEGEASIMKRVEAGGGERRDLRVRLRELDIY